ncbi:hypothetical protein HJG54_29590 [Leptolyngbya sp. NK1-12]|uniref:Dystroglycan-type cadherin-like domain-containing protein n=1 Tax=Leptolyngbya sp. NK1-12 TaxID=2547451 RepID=A0AA96WYK3_9CYAN|nr:hypothetical protein HJG54_29590 [Leptolyngbya sp. NK1-12]
MSTNIQATTASIQHQNAVKFWADMSNLKFLPLVLSWKSQQLNDQYDDLDLTDSFLSDFEAFLQDKLGYATTIAEVASFDTTPTSFDEARNEQLDFWRGSYFLFDPQGNHYVLSIRKQDPATGKNPIVFDGVSIVDYTFHNSTLKLNDDITGSLTFSMPTMPDNDTVQGDPVQWLRDRTSFQRKCTGDITYNDKPLYLIGRQGSYTFQGAKDDTHCDPLDYWTGVYNAVITDATDDDSTNPDPTVEYKTDLEVRLTNGTLSLNLLNGITVAQYRYFNNRVSWGDDNNGGQLTFDATFNSKRRMGGTITVNGKPWTVGGYFRHGLVAQPATRLSNITVRATGISIDKIVATLPEGDYSATLTATGGTAPYTWTATEVPPGFTLTPAGVLSGKAPKDLGNYTLKVTVTDANKATKTDNLTLKVVSPTLKIITDALPTVSKDKDYAVVLDAEGGDEEAYKWELVSGELPSGLKFNGDTGRISGKFTTSDIDPKDIAAFRVKVSCPVAGRTLTASRTFTLKCTSTLSTSEILEISTLVVEFLMGAGLVELILKAVKLRREAKKEKDKSGADSDTTNEAVDKSNKASSRSQSLAKESVKVDNDASDVKKSLSKSDLDEVKSRLSSVSGNIDGKSKSSDSKNSGLQKIKETIDKTIQTLASTREEIVNELSKTSDPALKKEIQERIDEVDAEQKDLLNEAIENSHSQIQVEAEKEHNSEEEDDADNATSSLEE